MNGPNWIMLMNYALISIVIAAWGGLLACVGWEVAKKSALKQRGLGSLRSAFSTLTDAHRIHIPELGMTMADGGEELKPSDSKANDKTTKTE